MGRVVAPSKLIYRLRLMLVDVEPPVWRIVQVPGNVTLYRLHLILQAAMDWTNSHLYAFLVGPLEYGYPDHEYGQPIIDGDSVQLHEIMRWPGTACGYLYDFGDDWHHILYLEAVEGRQEGVAYPRCLAGSGACPPEDVGGVTGYTEFLQVLTEPTHEEHDHFVQWAGGAFDPHAFDLDVTNQSLRRFQPRDRRSVTPPPPPDPSRP